MDAWDIGRVLRRRWKLSAGVAAALLLILIGVLFIVPPKYQTTAISLITPATSANVQNPYASVDKSQSQMAALLVTVLNSPQTSQNLTSAGAVGSIQITNANSSSDTTQTDNPFITITVTAPTADTAIHTAQLIRQQAANELQNRQEAAKVDPSQRLTLTEVLAPTDATTSRASQLRALGLVGALGIVLGAVGIVVVDRFLRTRTEKPAPCPA